MCVCDCCLRSSTPSLSSGHGRAEPSGLQHRRAPQQQQRRRRQQQRLRFRRRRVSRLKRERERERERSRDSSPSSLFPQSDYYVFLLCYNPLSLSDSLSLLTAAPFPLPLPTVILSVLLLSAIHNSRPAAPPPPRGCTGSAGSRTCCPGRRSTRAASRSTGCPSWPRPTVCDRPKRDTTGRRPHRD